MSGENGDGGRGPTGREAIDEIGDRLRDLLAGVKSALGQRAEAEDDAKAQDGARAQGGAAEKGSVKVETGWSIKLGGLELNGDSLEALKAAAERAADDPNADGAADGDRRSWRAAHPAARRRRAARPFRAARAEAPKPAPRAAHVEVFDEAEAVIVTAELPGAAQEDIELSLDGATLSIVAVGARPFKATARLPEGVDPQATPEMRLANGVLEIRLPKR